MTAHVFIHPRCLTGPAAGALEASLANHGFEVGSLAVGPPSAKGHHELVRLIDRQGDVLTLERLDGTQFTHVLQDASAPEVA